MLDLDDSDRPRIAYKDWNNEPWLAYNNSGTEGTWETVQVRNGYDLGGHMAMTLDYSTGTAYMAYRQYQWPAYDARDLRGEGEDLSDTRQLGDGSTVSERCLRRWLNF